MLPPGAILELKIHQNAFVGSLQRSPRNPSCFFRIQGRPRAGEGLREGRKGKGGRRERDRGDERPHFFFAT